MGVKEMSFTVFLIHQLAEAWNKKPAEVYEVLEKTERFALLKLLPQTGRTHQLRLHMSAIGHPLAGDWLYGTEDLELIPRAALHSCALHLKHPVTGETLELSTPLPEDMARLMTL